jgi:TfoX/Sxy family transcriptional regulator of competence genes
MATSKETIQALSDAFASHIALQFRAMFGEYACYHDGKLIGLICDNNFYLKITTALADFMTLERRSPYFGAKPHALLPTEMWGTEAAAELMLATSELLPKPKPKRKK